MAKPSIFCGKNDGNSFPFNLEGNSKQDIQAFIKEISKHGTYTSILSSRNLAQITDTIQGLNKIYCYENQGFINDSNLWLYSNAIVDRKTGDIYQTDTDGIISLPDKNILADIRGSKLSVLKMSDKYSPKDLAGLLLENIHNAYSGDIEPFIVLGNAIMAPYLDILRKKNNNGFPIPYIQGYAGSGKTSIARIIYSLYGFKENYIIQGTSTNKAILDNLGKNKERNKGNL